MDVDPIITLGNIRFVGAFADMKSYEADVTYTHDIGEPEILRIAFMGPTTGNAPVAMVTVGFPGGTWVLNPSRFGEQFDEEWIRNYYTDRSL